MLTFLNRIKTFIYNDYKENKAPFLIESVAVPVNILAAVLIAINPFTANFLLVYFLFLAASLMIMTSAYIRDNPWIFLLNLVFCAINILGIWSSL